MVEVCAIILNWNNKEALKKLLKSLKKYTSEEELKKMKIIVVDNLSDDGSIEYIKKYGKGIDLILPKEKCGAPEAFNLGALYAIKKYKPKYILKLDNDIQFIHRNWLEKVIETAKDASIGIVGCKVLNPDGTIQSFGRNLYKILPTPQGRNEKDKKDYCRICDTYDVQGSFMLIKTSLIKEIGFLDESFSPVLVDDEDFCWRAKKNGYRVVVNGFVRVIHQSKSRDQAIKDEKKEEKKFFIMLRNYLLSTYKHFPLSFKLARTFCSFWFCFLNLKPKRVIFLLTPQRNIVGKIKIWLDAVKSAILKSKIYRSSKDYKFEIPLNYKVIRCG